MLKKCFLVRQQRKGPHHHCLIHWQSAQHPTDGDTTEQRWAEVNLHTWDQTWSLDRPCSSFWRANVYLFIPKSHNPKHSSSPVLKHSGVIKSTFVNCDRRKIALTVGSSTYYRFQPSLRNPLGNKQTLHIPPLMTHWQWQGSAYTRPPIFAHWGTLISPAPSRMLTGRKPSCPWLVQKWMGN